MKHFFNVIDCVNLCTKISYALYVRVLCVCCTDLFSMATSYK